MGAINGILMGVYAVVKGCCQLQGKVTLTLQETKKYS